MILGNDSLRFSLRRLLLPIPESPPSDHPDRPVVVALLGGRFLGQSSLARELLQAELHEADFIEMKSGIDGAREVVEFANTDPIGSPIKAILVEDADRLSEPAQDALLKLLESPPNHLAIVLVAYDAGLLRPALASRIRAELRWVPLSTNKMREYASSLLLSVSERALEMAHGRPELYHLIVEHGGFDELCDSFISAARRELSILSKPPKIISDLENGYDAIRDAVVHVIRYSCIPFYYDPSITIPILKFCGVLSGSTSANAEIHWSRMIADLSV